jgi:hypothetical protein
LRAAGITGSLPDKALVEQQPSLGHSNGDDRNVRWDCRCSGRPNDSSVDLGHPFRRGAILGVAVHEQEVAGIECNCVSDSLH